MKKRSLATVLLITAGLMLFPLNCDKLLDKMSVRYNPIQDSYLVSNSYDHNL